MISRLAATVLVAAAATSALFVATFANWPKSESPTVIAVNAEPPSKEARQTRRRQPQTPPPALPTNPDVAPEATRPPAVVEISSPIWLSRPRHPERHYPQAAFAAGIAGEVLLDCSVALDGRLDCAIITETPPDWGFGEAALTLAGEHVMAPPMQDGAPVRGHYRMRIPFRAVP